MSRTKFIVGIDEVGRGPLAGPVTVGVFAVSTSDVDIIPVNLKNSKALSFGQREKWYEYFYNLSQGGKVFYKVSSVGHNVVDKRGIVFAIRLALARALERLSLKPGSVKVFLDGGLRAPVKYKNQETIIKGDEKVSVIAAASIIAKVTRDRFMIKITEDYPLYGFERHKGYGTRAHYTAIKKFGPSPVHRRTFLH